MNYEIDYLHLRDELVKEEKSSWYFAEVSKGANKYKLELLDEDFRLLFELKKRDKDINWIMHKMSVYKLPLIDVLVSYIVC